MNARGQAKFYYLYMMADGDISENEKKVFNHICRELNIDADEKKNIIKECKEIANEENMTCIEVLETNIKESHIYGTLSLDFDEYVIVEDKAKILWNLINLGYSDSYYTVAEREVVDYIREYWEIPDVLYQEMIEVAETCLALEKHRKWTEKLPDSEYKLKKLKQIKKDIQFTQGTIVTAISELNF